MKNTALYTERSRYIRIPQKTIAPNIAPHTLAAASKNENCRAEVNQYWQYSNKTPARLEINTTMAVFVQVRFCGTNANIIKTDNKP